MNYTQRACEHEAVWLDEAIFRAGQKGVEDAVAVYKKIQRNAAELNKAGKELQENTSKEERHVSDRHALLLLELSIHLCCLGLKVVLSWFPKA
jgi:hypothetical protein